MTKNREYVPDGCTCHISPPCAWCTSLTEDEAEAYAKLGVVGVYLHREKAEREAEQQLRAQSTMQCTTLTEYLDQYSSCLAQQAAAACEPLHVPGRDAILEPALLRPPFEAQAHVITGGIKALDRQQAIQIAAEMGTGKSLISLAIVQGHAQHYAAGGYRALVFCPPHLTHKWEREIRETVANAHVHHLRTYHDLTRKARFAPPVGRGWWIVSNTRAKMGAKWEPSFIKGTVPLRLQKKLRTLEALAGTSQLRWQGRLYCPACNEPLTKTTKAGDITDLLVIDLEKRKHNCEHCGEPLWQWTSQLDRWPIAAYLHKQLPGWFQYAVIDESHQTKSADTAIGQAMGALAAAADKTICLTGTLMGGYAWHVRPLLFRIAPRSLIAEGLGWKDVAAFDDRYGRIERKVTEVEYKGRDNRQSKGSTSKSTRYVRPGVMPTLFGRHLIQNTIFLSLDEVADNLPRLDEEVLGIEMDPELAGAYEVIEAELTAAIKEMLRKKDKRLLSTMLHVLLGYPDHPTGWGEVGYWRVDEETGLKEWILVTEPPDLDMSVVRPKEKALIDIVQEEWRRGRKCWVYCTMTDAKDVNERLRQLIADTGLRVSVLRSSVETDKRESWIAQHGPTHDALVSHPQLVETGLDLFDKSGAYNFPTLIFYSTGYNLFTMRQASRRSWRIGQTEDCRTVYLHYAGTMQARAMALMGKKLAASASIEGKFSAEGLAALAGDEGSLEVALAKSLVERLDDLDVGRAWAKLGQTIERKPMLELPRLELPISAQQPQQPQHEPGHQSNGHGGGQPGLKVAGDDGASHDAAFVLPPAPQRKPLDRHVSVKQMSLF